MVKRIGAVDSVGDDGMIRATISLDARGTPIQGSFCTIKCSDGSRWLIRIGPVTMENPIHENNQFAPIIMHNGNVPEWSGHTDIERAKSEVVSVIDSEGMHIPRLINPPSGTPIVEATNSEIQSFERERINFAVIGHVANSNKLPASIFNRNFGAWGDDGYGEARHLAVYGRNGSGKSVWVLVLLVSKIAAHREMGFLIPDTQGDFSDPTKHDRGEFKWNWISALARNSVNVETISIEDVALRSTRVLKKLLAPCFLRIYRTNGEKAADIADVVVDAMFDNDDVDPEQLTAIKIGSVAVDKIAHAFAPKSQQEKIELAKIVLEDPRRLEKELKKNVCPYFEGRHYIGTIVDRVLRSGAKIVISMDGMTHSQQMFVMEELLSLLKLTAQRIYNAKDKKPRPANAIILLDEAARWIPQGEDPDIKKVVLDSLRELRKAGVGLWIVGQSPADVDNAVLRQSHMKWFGRGLGVGADVRHLKENLSEQGVANYQELQMQPGRFFWVGIGLENNLGHDNTYIAVTPFDGDSTKSLIDANPHIWK